MSKWIAEFELEDGDKMPEHMDLEYHGVKLDFHCRPIGKTYEDGLNEAWECVRKIEAPTAEGGLSGKELTQIFKDGDTLYKVFKNYSAREAVTKIKEYEEKQKEPVFKVGDRVKTLVDKDSLGTEIFPTGTIGEVVGINGDSIAVESYDTTGYGYYRNDALELANDVFLVGDEVYLLDKNYRGVVTAVWEKSGVVKTVSLTQSGKLSCIDAPDLHRTGRRFPEIANILKQMQEGNNA